MVPNKDSSRSPIRIDEKSVVPIPCPRIFRGCFSCGGERGEAGRFFLAATNWFSASLRALFARSASRRKSSIVDISWRMIITAESFSRASRATSSPTSSRSRDSKSSPRCSSSARSPACSICCGAALALPFALCLDGPSLRPVCLCLGIGRSSSSTSISSAHDDCSGDLVAGHWPPGNGAG